MKQSGLCILLVFIIVSCKKNSTPGSTPANALNVTSVTINGVSPVASVFNNVVFNPTIKINFSAAIDTTTVSSTSLEFFSSAGNAAVSFTYANNDSTMLVQPASALTALTPYTLRLLQGIKSTTGAELPIAYSVTMNTGIDTTNKFPVITDSALLTLVQQQTFKYFWDFANPTSGMALERNTSGSTVTTGGSGFGVMAILVGIQRNFITRSEGLTRITTMVNFLINDAQRYHGAFPHWMNGNTGATIPFSPDDDGADIVETSYMMEGLLCARQYFNGANAGETALRDSINSIWNGIDWTWFQNSGQNVLYWNWSPDKGGFVVNVQVRGWCEALITYVLASSSNTDSIPIAVYTNGWAQNGNERNGNTYYGVQLPLGPAEGGPLFFAHYSFMGINPNSLTDAYANYWTQNVAHAQINYNYCVANPGNYNGYSASCWGLTASDDNNGYSAHAPDNDDGVISPTAAISSLPYTPVQSMAALHFFYYKLGDKIWSTYGFTDAFNLTNVWFATSFLAIDQGPQIVMIENYRSGMMWNLFMSCPEVQRGMLRLGFMSPYL